ncbi:MAG: nitronate monooxygenase, partial [Caulobacteraceae bacterium]
MSMPPLFEGRLSAPVIAAPLFIISQVELVLAQCRAGVVGSFPSLNARPSGVLEQWLIRLRDELTERDAPFAVNLIVHRSNERLEEDLDLCVKYQVPIVITSLGARVDVNEKIHGYGGIVLHDIIDDVFAHKAIDKGADGLIAVAAGAG